MAWITAAKCRSTAQSKVHNAPTPSFTPYTLPAMKAVVDGAIPVAWSADVTAALVGPAVVVAGQVAEAAIRSLSSAIVMTERKCWSVSRKRQADECSRYR